MSPEQQRLDFILARDGEAGVIDFCRRVMPIYRACVLQTGRNGCKFHHASLPRYRRAYIESYLVFKAVLRAYDEELAK